MRAPRQAVVLARIHRVERLRLDHDAVANVGALRPQPFADERLAAAAAVGVRGVEGGDAQLPGGVHDAERLVALRALAEERRRGADAAEVAAAEDQPRDRNAASAEWQLLVGCGTQRSYGGASRRPWPGPDKRTCLAQPSPRAWHRDLSRAGVSSCLRPRRALDRDRPVGQDRPMELRRWDDEPIEQLNESIGRQVLHTETMTVARIHSRRVRSSLATSTRTSRWRTSSRAGCASSSATTSSSSGRRERRTPGERAARGGGTRGLPRARRLLARPRGLAARGRRLPARLSEPQLGARVSTGVGEHAGERPVQLIEVPLVLRERALEPRLERQVGLEEAGSAARVTSSPSVSSAGTSARRPGSARGARACDRRAAARCRAAWSSARPTRWRSRMAPPAGGRARVSGAPAGSRECRSARAAGRRSARPGSPWCSP